MKHLIIHHFCIDLDLDLDSKLHCLNKKQKKRLITAKKVIDDVIEEGLINLKNVTVYRVGSSTLVNKLFEPEDKVTLYGAYLGKCLKNAHRVLQEKGVHVTYHPVGCIKCYNMH